MNRILITGINGSGASYLAEYLLTIPKTTVMGISRWHTDRSSNFSKETKDQIKFFECDLIDLGSVIRCLEECQPSHIFHLASNANVRLSFVTPFSMFNNNVNGTLNLLEALRILKAKPIVHFAGTSEVYGQVEPKDCPIKETNKIDPINVYAISKFTQEKLCKSYWLSYGIPAVLTRAFGYINPRRPDLFSSSFARQIVEIGLGKRSCLVHGNLDSVRTLVDVRDIVKAYWMSVESCNFGEEYNVGGIEGITVGDFLTKLVSIAEKGIGRKITVQRDPSLLRPVDVTMQIPDVSKFVGRTGWKPKYTLDESIQFLLDHYKKVVR